MDANGYRNDGGIFVPGTHNRMPGYDVFPQQPTSPAGSPHTTWVRPTLADDIAGGEPPIDPDDPDVVVDDNPDEN